MFEVRLFRSCLLTTMLLPLVWIGAASAADSSNFVFRGKPKAYDDYGYLVRGSAWRFPSGKSIIYVCWESGADKYTEEKRWVMDQITRTWGAYTPIEFRGWRSCAPNNLGIRIKVDDVGPHVKAFGKHINGKKNGMLLNFAFVNWSPACKEMKEACIRSIATHEFGHALGFAHEQNRPDTPGECYVQFGQGQPKEKPLTPYDPKSVMNYCNPIYNNNGKLSDLDIKAAQRVYGEKQ